MEPDHKRRRPGSAEALEKETKMAAAPKNERRWFDFSIRRPVDEVHDTSGELPRPTRMWTSTYSRGKPEEEVTTGLEARTAEDENSNEDIQIVLQGFAEDEPQTMVSSGLTTWEASDHLCDYLATTNEWKPKAAANRILELGSGLGKCGLLAHKLVHPPAQLSDASGRACTTLTDGDTNALQLLRKNASRNTTPNDNLLTCQQLVWGREQAQSFLARQTHPPVGSRLCDPRGGYDLILGSDLIYTGYDSRLNREKLFETVEALLDRHNGKFILAHNELHEVRLETIVWTANENNLFHEVIRQEGQVFILCFRKFTLRNVNALVRKLQERNYGLAAENRGLKASKGYLEDKCLCLEQRCAQLRGEKEDVPESILLAFGEDETYRIASYLEPRDFASLSMTCKQFGLKLHKIGTDPASLWQMVAHQLFSGATAKEKEALPTYDRQRSAFFFYNELLELRKPLQFDRIFGRGIDHAVDDRSLLVKSNRSGRVKMPRLGRRFYAYTAASNHVMRAGKHYVTFTCNRGPASPRDLMWFGIVRPLRRLKPKSLFTPFCTRFNAEMHALETDDEWGDSDVQSCVYNANTGECQWTDWDPTDYDVEGDVDELDWQGMQPFEGGRLGMLLDYDAGTLTLYKNDVKMGVMFQDLTGPYSWVVSVGTWFCRAGDGIKIDRRAPGTKKDEEGGAQSRGEELLGFPTKKI